MWVGASIAGVAGIPISKELLRLLAESSLYPGRGDRLLCLARSARSVCSSFSSSSSRLTIHPTWLAYKVPHRSRVESNRSYSSFEGDLYPGSIEQVFLALVHLEHPAGKRSPESHLSFSSGQRSVAAWESPGSKEEGHDFCYLHSPASAASGALISRRRLHGGTIPSNIRQVFNMLEK